MAGKKPGSGLINRVPVPRVSQFRKRDGGRFFPLQHPKNLFTHRAVFPFPESGADSLIVKACRIGKKPLGLREDFFAPETFGDRNGRIGVKGELMRQPVFRERDRTEMGIKGKDLV